MYWARFVVIAMTQSALVDPQCKFWSERINVLFWISMRFINHKMCAFDPNISGFGYDPDTPGSKSILWKTEEELKEPKSITVFDWTKTTTQQIYFEINEKVDTIYKVCKNLPDLITFNLDEQSYVVTVVVWCYSICTWVGRDRWSWGGECSIRLTLLHPTCWSLEGKHLHTLTFWCTNTVTVTQYAQ